MWLILPFSRLAGIRYPTTVAWKVISDVVGRPGVSHLEDWFHLSKSLLLLGSISQPLANRSPGLKTTRFIRKRFDSHHAVTFMLAQFQPRFWNLKTKTQLRPFWYVTAQTNIPQLLWLPGWTLFQHLWILMTRRWSAVPSCFADSEEFLDCRQHEHMLHKQRRT